MIYLCFDFEIYMNRPFRVPKTLIISSLDISVRYNFRYMAIHLRLDLDNKQFWTVRSPTCLIIKESVRTEESCTEQSTVLYGARSKNTYFGLGFVKVYSSLMGGPYVCNCIGGGLGWSGAMYQKRHNGSVRTATSTKIWKSDF